jgi:Mn-containing catalase
MASQNLADVVNSLTPQEQESVREFIEFLRQRGQSHPSPFLVAVDKFIGQHPELLRRLAQ